MQKQINLHRKIKIVLGTLWIKTRTARMENQPSEFLIHFPHESENWSEVVELLSQKITNNNQLSVRLNFDWNFYFFILISYFLIN